MIKTKPGHRFEATPAFTRVPNLGAFTRRVPCMVVARRV